ncbi:damage-control phosphatase ARMT1 family protein [Desulfurobacterium thermolithotrophum]|uniref:damage-control phosphatase ARMT1 family protein n=1 Tax=Desulfurobacterium thermolithotrophum TaxID=64160 RepID=UPI0013D77283|nr:ARMT1-like domain-containing protein [Desulfurobacterium thermolithotrophum]
MKVYPECIPCFMKQILNVSRIADIPDSTIMEVLKESAKFVAKDLKINKSPGHNATFLHRIFKEKTKIQDPYKSLKDKYTEIALRLEPYLEEEFYRKSDDQLSMAIRLAALGNVIDFGIPREFDLLEEIKNLLHIPFAYFDVAILERFFVPGKPVLYVADNAGEIVFDKFLLRELKNRGLKVIFAVRGGPILNDATVEDALKSGIAEVVDELITTGKDFIGIDFDFVSEEFKNYWDRAFFVISKGQANFETLDGINSKDIFFILKAKCKPVAKELNCNVNDLIFLYNKHLLEIAESAGTK